MIRDSRGLFMTSYAQGLDSLFCPPVVEALAILRSLKLAIEMGLLSICVESDAKVVIVEEYNVVSLVFVPQKTNQVAHRFTKFDLTFINDFIWLEGCPLSVKQIALDDCSV
ncbi:hypothetical protein ACOSP7_000764 [Xanthoceras sorbifolium]